jgi:ABC-2 type transport system ATP-binding protein
MILVEHLVKRYPGVTAVNDISFHVQRGEIVGFLGPNGAGKTTTMRILTGYIPATSGSAVIAGFDVRENSLEVRRRIGYLPENNPLYPEMRVAEYLKFRARLKGVRGRRLRERASRVMEQCGLTEVSRKLIAHLSKGFRQRVGIADSLIHDPELVILDEPTIGLDPNQIQQVRRLIMSLKKSHTVLLSTHILPEVEMTCDSAIILNRGRIICADKVANLTRRSFVRADVRGPREDIEKALRALPEVKQVIITADGDYWQCEVDAGGADVRENIFALAAQRQWTLRELSHDRLSMEDIFIKAVTTDAEE